MSSPQPAPTHGSPGVAASSTLALVHYLRHRGVLVPERVEALLGITLGDLENPDLRIPAEAHYRLWQHAEQVTGDPAIGLHAGQVVDPERMGLVGHVFFNCDTLGEAVAQYVRLHRLINESVNLSFEREGELAILCWQPDTPELYCRQDMDRTLAAALSRTRHFILPKMRATWAEIGHPRPDYAGEYDTLLGGPASFGHGWMRVAFPARHLDHPIPHRNPYVYSAVLRQVNFLLARLRTRRAFSRRVRRLIARQHSEKVLKRSFGSFLFSKRAAKSHLSRCAAAPGHCHADASHADDGEHTPAAAPWHCADRVDQDGLQPEHARLPA